MRVVFTTVVMLYLALDFGDPNLPGANSFDVEESVVVVQAQRAPAPTPPLAAVSLVPLLRLAPVRLSSQRLGPQVRRHAGLEPTPRHDTRHRVPDPSSPEAD